MQHPIIPCAGFRRAASCALRLALHAQAVCSKSAGGRSGSSRQHASTVTPQRPLRPLRPHPNPPSDAAPTRKEKTEMETITLYFRQGASDKIYQAAIEPKDGGYVVTFA